MEVRVGRQLPKPLEGKAGQSISNLVRMTGDMSGSYNELVSYRGPNKAAEEWHDIGGIRTAFVYDVDGGLVIGVNENAPL